MQTEKVARELLEYSCPSITYRIRLELLNQSRLTRQMRDLQKQILDDAGVKEVMSRQQPDGWLAWSFHGYRSTESGIRLLCEKGVDRGHPVLSSALRVLATETGRLSRGIGKVGAVLDSMGFGGAQMIRATLFACAGIEDKSFVREQIDLALAGFRAVLEIDTIDDLVEMYRGKQVYRQGTKWPSIYHLRLLALTHVWRTPENQQEIAQCIQRLVKLSPLPTVSVRLGSQLIAPASFCMDHFDPDMSTLNDAQWMMWFHRMEMLSRLGVAHLVPELKRQVSALTEMLDVNNGRFTKPLTHEYFRKWGAYTGLMLEKDWRDPRRRIADLTFRSLLILHYFETQAA